MCAKRNFVIVLSLIAAMLSASTGCDAQVSEKTLHQKLGWKAEDFFADPKVIELCRAIEKDDLKEIEALIAGGVDVNAKGKDNMTPLMWAFPDEKLSRFEMLLRAGADPNVYITSDLGVPNGFTKGDSVTHMACRTYFPYFKAVFENGGDPNLIDGRSIRSGETPIFSVVEGAVPDSKERIKLLIEKGADVNHCLKDFSGGGNVLLYAAIHYGQYDICSFLIDQGCDPSVYDHDFSSKLTHILVRANISPDFASSQQITDYHNLVAKIEAMGESMEEARAYFKKRFDPMISRAGKMKFRKEQQAANKAAWLARQAAKEKAVVDEKQTAESHKESKQQEKQ